MASDNTSDYLPDVSGFKLFSNGTVEVLYNGTGLKGRPEFGPRGRIERLSSRSRQRLAFTVFETKVTFKSMMTLTYPEIFPKNGKVVKNHLNRFLNYVRRNVAREYLWFLEFQRRGAPHFHVLLSEAVGDRQEFALQWARIAAGSELEAEKVVRVHSHRSQWQNVKKPDAAQRYALKYALKPYQKYVPRDYQDVGRFWGASRGVKESVPDGLQYDCTEIALRALLTQTGHAAAKMEFLPKYVFLSGI